MELLGGEFPVADGGEVEVKGFSRPVKVFEIDPELVGQASGFR